MFNINIDKSSEQPLEALSEQWLLGADQNEMDKAIKSKAKLAHTSRKKVVEFLAQQPAISQNPTILIKLAISGATKGEKACPLSKICRCSESHFIEQLKRMNNQQKAQWFRQALSDPPALDSLLRTGWTPPDGLLDEIFLGKSSNIDTDSLQNIILYTLQKEGGPSPQDLDVLFKIVLKYHEQLSPESLVACLTALSPYDPRRLLNCLLTIDINKTIGDVSLRGKLVEKTLGELVKKDQISRNDLKHFLSFCLEREHYEDIFTFFTLRFPYDNQEIFNKEMRTLLQKLNLGFERERIVGMKILVYLDEALRLSEYDAVDAVSSHWENILSTLDQLEFLGENEQLPAFLKLLDEILSPTRFALSTKLQAFNVLIKIKGGSSKGPHFAELSLQDREEILNAMPMQEVADCLKSLPSKEYRITVLHLMLQQDPMRYRTFMNFGFSEDLVDPLMNWFPTDSSAKPEVVKPLLKSILNLRDPALKANYCSCLFKKFQLTEIAELFLELSKHSEREQLVGMEIAKRVATGEYSVDPEFDSSTMDYIKSILSSVNKLKDLKDGQKLREFLLMIGKILEGDDPGLSEKLRMLDSQLKGATSWPKIKNALQLINLLMILPSTQRMEALKNPKIDSQQIVTYMFEQMGFIGSGEIDRLWQLQQKLFSQNPLAPLVYWNKLSTLPEIDKIQALEGLKMLMDQAFDGTFQKERYALKDSPHLQLIFATRPELLELWKTGLSFPLEELVKDLDPSIKGWTCEDSDKLEDLFFMGHVTESCQRTSGDPTITKGLLGIMNGKTRLLCIKDANKKVVGRAVIRILMDSINNKPIILLEPIYNSHPPGSAMRGVIRDALVELGQKKSEQLLLPLLGTEISLSSLVGTVTSSNKSIYSGNAVFEKDKAPFEYSDSGNFGKPYDKDTVLTLNQGSIYQFNSN